MYIGDRIKHLRKEKGIRQQDLACKGLTRTVLSKIETNKMLPSLLQLEYICEKLNVTSDYLLGKENNSNFYNMKYHNKYSSYLLNMYNEHKFLEIIELYEKHSNKFSKNMYDYYYIAKSYFQLDMISQALEMFNKFIDYYQKFSNDAKYKYVEHYAESLNIISWSYNKKYKRSKAIHCLYLARDELIKYDKLQTRISFIIHNNIGSICYLHGKYDETINILEDFLQKNNDHGYIYSLACMHLSLNLAYYAKGDYEKAIYNIKKAILLFDYAEKSIDSHECYINYVNSLRFLNQFDDALSLLSKFKNKYLGSSKIEGIYLILEMITYFNTGNYKKVVELSKNIKITNLRLGSRMDYFFIMGHIEFLNNNFHKSKKYFKRCESYFLRNNYLKDLNLMYDDLKLINKDEDYYYSKYVDTNKTHYKKNICL